MTDASDEPSLPLPDVDGDANADAVPSFDEPWQARAFGVAVALADGSAVGGEGADDAGPGNEDAADTGPGTDGHGYEWTAFQSRLIEAIGEDGGDRTAAVSGTDSHGDGAAAVDGAYYRQWLAALERLLDERDLVDRTEVAERAAEFAAGDRDASEFVDGDR